MFCFNCGQQIPDEVQFCFKCGTLQKSDTSRTKSVVGNNNTTTSEFDREAIKIYLSNILALECFIQKLNADYDVINGEIENFQSKNYNERFQCSRRNYAWLRYDGNKFYLWFDRDNKGEYFLGMDENSYAGGWFSIDENIEYLNNPENFPSTYTCLNILGAILTEPIICSIQSRKNKNGFWKAYEHFKSTAPQKYKENRKRIIPSMNKRSGIENEIKKAKALLQKAYNINIIPKQFRNIYAIWFIHDYVTTSTETLSAAFLQCNLDEIKQKLDRIIEQQREMIMNQRFLMAQNTRMLEQNQQILNRLANIESNTERAAQYAEIASNNAEACAWINMANYIKK